MSYHPTLGRFIQRDPMGYVGGGSAYQYVTSNPASWLDPGGLLGTPGTQPGAPGGPTTGPTSGPTTKPTSGPSQVQSPLLFDGVPWTWNGAFLQPDLEVFAGFENARYQSLDWVIALAVMDFNRNKTQYCGCNAEQADGTNGRPIPDLDPNLVKSWLIQETGGNDARSRRGWLHDPATVNHPGDWSDWKKEIGLARPGRAYDGDLVTNIRAALAWLCRKGFGRSGQPGSNRPGGFFDGWEEALKRYGPPKQRDTYWKRISDRARDPQTPYPIELNM